MPYPIEVISLGCDFYADIEGVIKRLNDTQTEFRFHLPPLRLRTAGIPFGRQAYQTTEVWKFLGNYRTNAKGHRPYLIAIVDGELSSLRLGNLFGSTESEQELAVFTLLNQAQFTNSRSAFICYYLIRYSLGFIAPDIKPHLNTRGCFFDKKMLKSDLLLSMQTGELCDNCRSALQEHFNPELSSALLAMVQILKEFLPTEATKTIGEERTRIKSAAQKVPLNFGELNPFGAPKQEFEDGTNIAFGTPFREEFTARRLPWYIPSEAKGSLKWKENLTTLRARFDNFIDQHCATECFVIQMLIPQIGEFSRKPPGILQDRQFLSSGPGLRKEPAKLFGVQKTLAAAFAILNVRGEPFVEPDGQPMPFRLGLNRYFTVQAVPDGLRALPILKLAELLGDGKNALLYLPPEIAVKIWRNWRSGFSQRDSSYLWLDALFELAWQRERGSSFHTERYAWVDNGSIALAGKGLFPRLPNIVMATPGEFFPHENGYPRAFYSKMADIARASIAAIDEILEFNTEPPKYLRPISTGIQTKTMSKTEVFISYSHKDKRFLDELLTHLKPIERYGRSSPWSDKQIQPGSKWFDEIQAALSRTRIAVLLVSAHFLASEFIHENELTPLLKRAEEEGVRILWIPVRACAYTETPIQKYQALISPDKPLAQMKSERDEAWVKICGEIQKAIATLTKV